MNDLPFGFQPPGAGDGGDESGPTDPLAAMLGGQDLGAMLQQLGRMLSNPASGPVHWDLARDTARQAVAAAGDASVTPGETGVVDDAFRLADLWLDDVTPMPSGVTRTAAWSRAEWVEQTLPRWQPLVEPVAARVATASQTAVPDEVRTMAGPLLGMMQQMTGAMFGGQVGQGMAALAAEVIGSTDVGLPLAEPGVAVLLPANVAAFGEGLGLPLDDVRIFLALREAAHLRLFHHAPWLATRILAAVDDYARGISIDTSGIEAAMSGINPADPAALQELMAAGRFEPPTTPAQQAALDRLETLLALVEGWVDTVVFAAASGRLTSAAALRESVRRRRATGGPAETTFATLVGLDLRPRRLREAASLWNELGQVRGPEARDAVWDHPDLLPSAADLDDPSAFVAASASPGLDLADWDLTGEDPDAGDGAAPPAAP